MLKMPMAQKSARVVMWRMKIDSATTADSVMPIMARTAKSANTTMVAIITLNCG